MKCKLFIPQPATVFASSLMTFAMLLAVSLVHAQSLSYDQQTRPPSEEKQNIAAQPNRNGVFEGINIRDNTVVISGKGYPAVINPSRIPTLANGNPMPSMMIPEGARIQFNVDNDGRVTAIWVDGDLTH